MLKLIIFGGVIYVLADKRVALYFMHGQYIDHAFKYRKTIMAIALWLLI